MSDRAKIVIAEDQRIVREGLKALLTLDGFDIVGEAEDGLEAVGCVEALSPDLLLVDLSMPRMSGVSAIRDIKARIPETRILVLTIHGSEECVMEAFQAGADGYCLKNASHTELAMAVRHVLAGNRYISPGISDQVLEGYLREKGRLTQEPSWENLTPREKDVLKMVGEGYKNKEIAEYLAISVKTVEKHRSNIMKKLDLHTAAALTTYAIEKGLIAGPIPRA